eukprot:scaffold15674_cov148-Skeletonema_marinoi.AAC.3
MPPQHQSDSNELLSELESHNEFFDGVVNIIPARLYVAGHSGDDAYNVKYNKGQHKESKEAKKARSKIAKREKFDPEKVETTLETKRRLRQEQEEEEDSDNDSDIVMSDGDGQEDDDAEGSADAADGNKTEVPTDNFASRIEMLRAKLHAKMSEKRAAAGISEESQAAAVDTSSPALVSKRAARRAEKMKRKQAAQQRNQKKSTTMAEKNKEPQRVINLGGSTYNAPTASTSEKASKKSAAEDLATIDFQSLAGLKPKMDAAFNDKSLNPKTANKKKSLEKLLADAEKKQQRLRELKASGDKEDREKAQNIEWGEALKTAEGKNIRKTTDPKLIKKEMKKRAKKKAASAKTWGDRVDSVKEQKDKRQQIRSHNLDARRQGGALGANLSSKRIKEDDDDKDKGDKGSKRKRQGPHSDQGRNRAGFEGKKQGFINGDSAGGAEKGKR